MDADLIFAKASRDVGLTPYTSDSPSPTAETLNRAATTSVRELWMGGESLGLRIGGCVCMGGGGGSPIGSIVVPFL